MSEQDLYKRKPAIHVDGSPIMKTEQYPTVFLSFRKWIALMLANLGSGIPCLFVARFTDAIYYIDSAEVDARKMRLAGMSRIVKSHTDIEPIIDIPIHKMKLACKILGGEETSI